MAQERAAVVPLGLMLALWPLGCQRAQTEYYIDKHYVGPCLVLVTPPRAQEEYPTRVQLVNGVATVSFRTAQRGFVFKSGPAGAPLTEIPLGQHAEANDTARHVFQLTSGYFSRSTCLNNVANVSFYVGRQADYTRWSRTYHDETEYFASRGIDLCRLYTAGRTPHPGPDQPLRIPRSADEPEQRR